jgi:hypothetical protein
MSIIRLHLSTPREYCSCSVRGKPWVIARNDRQPGVHTIGYTPGTGVHQKSKSRVRFVAA